MAPSIASSIIPDAVMRLYGGAKAAENLRSVELALEAYGDEAGLTKPHRLAHFLAQLAHESGSFRYDREVWGPTPAQARYDTRTDLGNTPEKDDDGFKNRGRGPIQVTGGYNIGRFEDWCRQEGLNPPDFTANPDLINTDPWEGLSAVWYWTAGNPTGKSLNALADANNIEQITKRINGGLNGYADRIAQYVKIALVLAGYGPDDVRGFQIDASRTGAYTGDVDGDAGPQTRAALHKWLANASASAVAASPVVEQKAVVPEAVEKQVDKKFSLFGWIGGLVSGGGLSLAGLAGMDWQAIVALGGVLIVVFLVAILLRGQIVAAVKDIRGAVEDADA